MGSRRYGAGANLTPNQAKERLAIPCLLLLLDAALLDFRTSTITSPARTVYIRSSTKTAGVADSILQLGVGLTMMNVAVNDKQWDTAVRPVLEDPRFNPRTPLNQHRIDVGLVSQLVDEIGEALRLSFISAGYGPS